MNHSNASRPISATGIGLRSQHIDEILINKPDIPWLEILVDNHLADGGLIPAQLDAVSNYYPITLHGVGLSLGSTSPLDIHYLQQIKNLSERINARWYSEHLCFTSVNGHYSHDLLPMPYSQASLIHIVDRIDQVQNFFGEKILIENVSSYMNFVDSTMPEAEFLCAVAEQADCWLLVDVNNIYVNQENHGIDADDYIDLLPLDRIKEIHLAGFQQREDFLLDAHNHPVSDPVWKLYKRLLKRKSDIPTLIEWDNDIPALSVLMQEANKANQIRLAVEIPK
jgi:uncharacterized protein (UPF0276 family)